MNEKKVMKTLRAPENAQKKKQVPAERHNEQCLGHLRLRIGHERAANLGRQKKEQRYYRKRMNSMHE